MTDPRATTLLIRVAFREWFEPVEFAQLVLEEWNGLGLRPLHFIGKSGPPEAVSTTLLEQKLRPGCSIPEHYLELKTSRKRSEVDSMLIKVAPKDWDWNSPYSDLGTCAIELSTKHIPAGNVEETALALLVTMAGTAGVDVGTIDNLGAILSGEGQTSEWELCRRKAQKLGKAIPKWCHLFGPMYRGQHPTPEELLLAGYTQLPASVPGTKAFNARLSLFTEHGTYRQTMVDSWKKYTTTGQSR